MIIVYILGSIAFMYLGMALLGFSAGYIKYLWVRITHQKEIAELRATTAKNLAACGWSQDSNGQWQPPNK